MESSKDTHIRTPTHSQWSNFIAKLFKSNTSSCNPLSSLSPPHSPLATVRLFLTSMSLVRFCLLFSSVDYMIVFLILVKYMGNVLSYESFTLMLHYHTGIMQ